MVISVIWKVCLKFSVLVYKTFDLKPGGQEKMKRVARLEKGRSFGVKDIYSFEKYIQVVY